MLLKAFLSFLARKLLNLLAGALKILKRNYFRMNHFKRKFSNFRNKPSTPTIPERTIRIDDHTLESGNSLIVKGIISVFKAT